MELIHQFLPEHILQALGWTVIHSLWQAFAVAMLLSAYLLAWQKTDARKRYIAGNFALASTLLLAVATFVYYFEKNKSQVVHGNEIIGADGTVLGQYFLENDPAFFNDYFNQNMPLIVTVWLVGLLFFMLKMLGGLLYIQRLKTRLTAPLTKHWQDKLSLLSSELNIARPVRLLESALAQAPMVVGWLKPIILLPMGALNNLTPQQVEAILAHELAHIARHDYLLNLLQSCIEILFYFNPAVWWMSANVRTERENCCDDIAVRLCGNSLAYAKALVSLQELQLAAPAFAMPFSKNKNQLLLRIQRILQPSQNKSNVMEKLSATLLLTVAVVLLSVQANTPFGNLVNRVVSEGLPAFKADAHVPEPVLWGANDTIPEGSQDAHIHYNTDEEDIEVRMKDDEIVWLKVDGENIPAERFGEFEDRVREILADVPAPPDYPEIPDFPELPELPAMPEIPAFGEFPVPPAFDELYAPAAPPFPGSRTRKIITQKNRNGTTFIIENEDGSDPVEITVEDGKKGTIIVNGQEITGLKKGDKTIIMQDVPGGYYLNGEAYNDYNADNFRYEMQELAEYPAIAPEAFEDRRSPLWDSPESQELRRLMESGHFTMEEINDRFNKMPKSEEWRAEMDALMARGAEDMRLMLEQQQQKIEEHRDAMELNREKATKDARLLQKRQLETMELQRQTMDKFLKQSEKERKEMRRPAKAGSM